MKTTIFITLSRHMMRICAAGMALLGFSCSSEDPICMYGTPTGSFEIKGKVTDEAGRPVEGATMRAAEPEIPSGISSIATSTSGRKGEYDLAGSSFPSGIMKVVCLPSDPALEPDSTTVEMNYVKDRHDSNDWSEGKASATVNFTLKKKTDD